MSISPQSLARTRDKRSLKVPARFNDTVYNDVHYREATEVLRASTRSRPDSKTVNCEPDIVLSPFEAIYHEETDEEGIDVSKEILAPIEIDRAKSSNKAARDKKSAERRKKAREEANRLSLASKAQKLSSKHDKITTGAKLDAASLASNQARPLAEQIPNPPTEPVPTITENSFIELAEEASKPIASAKKRSSSSSSSSRKKPPGISLIFKQPSLSPSKKQEANERTPPKLGTTILGGSSNFTICHHNQPIPPLPNAKPISVIPSSPTQQLPNVSPINQGTRYVSGLLPSRTLINEPIYLPRSVRTIAPITLSPIQWANQLRRPPFISKKAEACLAYQDSYKLNYMTSIHSSLVKIAQHLGTRDRLNLRCASRTWKSIMDLKPVWERLILSSDDHSINLSNLEQQYSLSKITKEVLLNQYESNDTETSMDVAFQLNESYMSLERVKIISTNAKQNSIAFSILALLGFIRSDFGRMDNSLQIEWHVKVGVDPTGIANVTLSAQDLDNAVCTSLKEHGLEEETSDTGEENSLTIELHDIQNALVRFADFRKYGILIDVQPI